MMAMKFSIEAKALGQGLAAVGRVISARPTHPILSCVLVTAYKGEVILKGFDLSLGVQLSLLADVESLGSVAIPAKLFSELVTKVDGVLNVEVTQNEYGARMATIKYNGGEMELLCHDPNEYPDLPTLDVAPLEIPSEALKEGIKHTAFAASTDDTKQILTGVHISGGNGRLEFAATDGHRLAKLSIPVEGNLDVKITLPSRALKELEKILGDDSVSMMADDSQAIFQTGSNKLTCRVLEGTYPPYNQLIPAQFERVATMERKKLNQALDRIGIFTTDKNKLMGLELKEHDVVVSSNAQDIGQGRDTFAADIQGQPIQIGFNLAYLKSGLGAFSTEELRLHANEAIQPVILTPVDGADFTYLIMPVALTPAS